MPYGRQDDDDVKIGSLELLQASSTMTLFNTTDPALRTGSEGEETAAQVLVDVPDEGFDLVIMNPPFTRAGSDWEGSGRKEDYVKQFRGLSTDLDTQKEMSALEKEYSEGTCAHGYAGIASTFAALGHRKLKPGGILALVLPLSAAVGQSWGKFRQMLDGGYTDISVLSIAANGKDMSFSSDTGMAECLAIARKRTAGEASDKRVRYTSLNRRPNGFAHAAVIANNIIGSDALRKIEDGPYGGTQLMVGEELAGEMLSTQGDTDSESWAGVRLSDYSLAQTAYYLAQSKLWLPGTPAALNMKISPLNEVGNRGFYHMNVAGRYRSAPFTKTQPSPTATYPSLWNHDAKRETKFVCSPDSQLLVKSGSESKAAEVWSTASRAHINLDFTFGSQPLAVAFTEQDSIGGRVWPNVIFNDKRFDYAFAVWGNSTLGLLSYWWHSSRQQSSKASITVSSLESLPILDLRALNDDQLATSEAIFDEFRDKELKPAYIADADPNRALLDKRVVCDLLGFGEDTYEAVRRLSAKWCAEPSVHGGKRRPRGAGLVV